MNTCNFLCISPSGTTKAWVSPHKTTLFTESVENYKSYLWKWAQWSSKLWVEVISCPTATVFNSTEANTTSCDMSVYVQELKNAQSVLTSAEYI